MKNNLFLGSLFTITSAFFYAVQTAFIKYSAMGISLPVIVFSQCFVSLMLVLVFLIFWKKEKFFSVTHSTIKKKHFARAVFSLCISYFLFASLGLIPYFDAIVLYNSAPLFVPLLTYLILKNKINHKIWLSLMTGFIGVVLTFNPDNKIFSAAAILAMMSGISAALSIIMMREISKSDGSLKNIFYYFFYSTLISGIISIPFWGSGQLNWYALFMIGALFFLVQLFLTLAAMNTSAQVVSTLYYSNILFSLFAAYLLFNEKLSLSILVGAICIMVGGLGVIRGQRKMTNFM